MTVLHRGAVGARSRMPVGAELVGADAAHFRVWAPERKRVEVTLENVSGDVLQSVALDREDEGYFGGVVERAREGTLYRYRLDGGERFPDPASRFQPRGPHGPSCVVNPAKFAWTDGGWRGCHLAGAVLYEMHIGTFTREGSWTAAARELPSLAELGISVIELMHPYTPRGCIAQAWSVAEVLRCYVRTGA
jgi:maltooligosyltrehalose trehalohydrolase